jgi:hypothetical protein
MSDFTSSPFKQKRLNASLPDVTMSQYINATIEDQLFHGLSSVAFRPLQQIGTRQGVRISAEQAKEDYGIEADGAIYEKEAQLIAKRKKDEANRQFFINRGGNGIIRKATGLAVGLATSFFDPLELGASLIPVVGQVRKGKQLAKGASGLTKALSKTKGAISKLQIKEESIAKVIGPGKVRQGIAIGVVDGAFGTGIFEPLRVMAAEMDQTQYDWTDAAINMGFGAIIGGALRGGMTAASDVIGRISQDTHEAAFRSAYAELLEGADDITRARDIVNLDKNKILDDVLVDANYGERMGMLRAEAKKWNLDLDNLDAPIRLTPNQIKEKAKLKKEMSSIVDEEFKLRQQSLVEKKKAAELERGSVDSQAFEEKLLKAEAQVTQFKGESAQDISDFEADTTSITESLGELNETETKFVKENVLEIDDDVSIKQGLRDTLNCVLS